MIEYETADSPFFVAHKNYCESIEKQFKTLDIACSGFCNSYGYDIESTFHKNNLTYHIKFLKHQTTQNGVVIPRDANEYAGTEIKIEGLNKEFKVNTIDGLAKEILDGKISKFKLAHGNLKCVMHIAMNDPVNLIAELELMVKNWI